MALVAIVHFGIVALTGGCVPQRGPSQEFQRFMNPHQAALNKAYGNIRFEAIGWDANAPQRVTKISGYVCDGHFFARSERMTIAGEPVRPIDLFERPFDRTGTTIAQTISSFNPRYQFQLRRIPGRPDPNQWSIESIELSGPRVSRVALGQEPIVYGPAQLNLTSLATNSSIEVLEVREVGEREDANFIEAHIACQVGGNRRHMKFHFDGRDGRCIGVVGIDESSLQSVFRYDYTYSAEKFIAGLPVLISIEYSIPSDSGEWQLQRKTVFSSYDECHQCSIHECFLEHYGYPSPIRESRSGWSIVVIVVLASLACLLVSAWAIQKARH